MNKIYYTINIKVKKIIMKELFIIRRIQGKLFFGECDLECLH